MRILPGLRSMPVIALGSPYAVGFIAEKQEFGKAAKLTPFPVRRGGEPYDEGVILFSRVRVK
jgi:hypothetical protein